MMGPRQGRSGATKVRADNYEERDLGTIKEIRAALGGVFGRRRSPVPSGAGPDGTGGYRRDSAGYLGQLLPGGDVEEDDPLPGEGGDPDARQLPWRASLSCLVAAGALARPRARLARRCGVEPEVPVARDHPQRAEIQPRTHDFAS